ncbi:hypothetical protein CEUSTIGMA_g10490.t1 [Chlamydomonas eustigma]|uniref:DUF1995 domain-containing protein n=1 Tax=Chlamydomonas eustigma TaxID=1157962 RepID=A0A250XJ07_9CHLO|nr:hypothetical protein CEUSTIGMA_g10490.t1 [Chlamydomonas eustigma]|eukprot:GAX83064.1 hypothetical protein CEUSTIGMA_g10490.t1 [Chlamydomonas eustigma]
MQCLSVNKLAGLRAAALANSQAVRSQVHIIRQLDRVRTVAQRTDVQYVFPANYDQALRQAQEAVKAAVLDGHKILEVDFPVGGLTGVQGDGEGQTEMNACMGYLRQFMNAWRQEASTTRIFFPDSGELAVALSGQNQDPVAGRAALEPQFADSRFQLGYLTKQNAAWALFGVNFDKWSPAELVKDTDTLIIVAYPWFNPKEELSATLDLYERKAKGLDIPMVIFNGDLDKIRGSYHIPMLAPVLSKISDSLIPKVTAAYYIHNFKGSRPGALFYRYPGPWQVLRRNPTDPEVPMKVIWTGTERPTLKQVSLEILPSDL